MMLAFPPSTIKLKTGVKARTAIRLYNSYTKSPQTSPFHSTGGPSLHMPAQRRRILGAVDTNQLVPFTEFATQEG